MAKTSVSFVCSECGSVYKKWSGRCDNCGAWNSIVEDAGLSAAGPAKKSLGGQKGRAVELHALAGEDAETPRAQSGIAEFDRVLGGGLAPASAILVGGDPGIGKSTLLLQAVDYDGGFKCQVRFDDGSLDIVPGSRVEVAEG